MLDTLTRRISGIFAGLRRKGRLSESDVQEMLREIRVALLEADVNFQIAKDFVSRVREKAVGEELYGSLSADQTLVRIVRDELTELLGGKEIEQRVAWAPSPPTVFLLCGLQGSGKTTTAAKLGSWLQKQGKRVLLAACDVQRPAAVHQLQVLGEQIGAEVFSKTDGTRPVEIAREAYGRAKHMMLDAMVVDTAGRLQIDEPLMEELRAVHKALSPTEVLLVADSTTGQEAVNVAKAFHESVPLTGAIFTKLDGDTRGGAVLSVREATGVPVRFIGVGEAVDALEAFVPDRMAQRILGMGDVLGIIERAESAIDLEEAKGLEAKILKGGGLDFADMLAQFKTLRKMGPLQNVLKMLPGVGAQLPEGALDQIDEGRVNRVEAIILSMTPEERSDPDIINGSRRKRIALGAGSTVEEVNALLRQLYEMRKNVKQMAKLQKRMAKFGKRR